MSEGGGKAKVYNMGGSTTIPPQFRRTMAALSDRDLLEELELGLGKPDFMAAVRTEIRRRGLERRRVSA